MTISPRHAEIADLTAGDAGGEREGREGDRQTWPPFQHHLDEVSRREGDAGAAHRVGRLATDLLFSWISSTDDLLGQFYFFWVHLKRSSNEVRYRIKISFRELSHVWLLSEVHCKFSSDSSYSSHFHIWELGPSISTYLNFSNALDLKYKGYKYLASEVISDAKKIFLDICSGKKKFFLQDYFSCNKRFFLTEKKNLC